MKKISVLILLALVIGGCSAEGAVRVQNPNTYGSTY